MNKKFINVNYKGDDSFVEGLNELSNDLRFILSKEGKLISGQETSEKIITVFADGDTANFTYYDKASFYRAFSIALQKLAEGGGKVVVKPLILNLGTMQNCAFTVMNVDTIKKLIREHAIMGYNYIQLYTEVAYEIPSEPYFGYKIGRYTQDELKELVKYSKIFGVEMIPCIQTLGHLMQLFDWGAFSDVFDIKDTMLVNYERTYELIDKMLESLSQCFDTQKINLGMDEAYWMGFGRYNWFIDDTQPNRSLLFINHLKRVLQIAEKYNFTEPSIWFDNLFGINYKGYIDPPEWLWKDFSKEICDSFPKVKLIYWNYVIRSVDDFKRFVGYVRQLSSNVSFASMAHGYTSFAPENYVTEMLVDTAKTGCLECNIDDIMITWWGSIMSPHALIPSYYNYAEKLCVSEGVDLESRCKFLFGYSYSEFKLLDSPNVIGETSSELKLAEGNNLPFYALANDPFLGKLDKHIPVGCENEYSSKARELLKLSKVDSRYAFIYKFESILCETLSKKAELGIKIKKAYDAKDLDALDRITKEIPNVIRSVKKLHISYRKYFLSFAKSQSLVKWDNRFGGIILRLEQVKLTIKDYILGEILCIPELEEERLPIRNDKVGEIISYRDWILCSFADNNI